MLKITGHQILHVLHLPFWKIPHHAHALTIPRIPSHNTKGQNPPHRIKKKETHWKQKTEHPKLPLMKLKWDTQISLYKTKQNPTMSSSKKQALFIASLIILWYSSNIGVLLLNKLLLSNYGFRFPIFLTMCHMSACAILSYLSIVFFKIVPLQVVKSKPQLLKIATLSVVFCGSVVGGNISLRYLPVSFNQAVGATTPFFTAVFAYLMTFKREAWVTYGALVPVVVGVIIASGVSSILWIFNWF